MNTEEVYISEFIYQKTLQPTSVLFGIERIDEYQKATEIQMVRIEDAVKRIILFKKTVEEFEDNLEYRSLYGSLFIEIHFYFIIWSQINSILKLINNATGIRDFKEKYDKYKKILEKYVAGRNSFEHYDERLPGQKEYKRVKAIVGDNLANRKIMRGFSKDFIYSHSDQKWDVSRESLKKLNEIINEYMIVFDELIKIRNT
jgi:hypothetical protein